MGEPSSVVCIFQEVRSSALHWYSSAIWEVPQHTVFCQRTQWASPAKWRTYTSNSYYWLGKRTETCLIQKWPRPSENKDGTFNWRSWLLVNLSVHRENARLSCLVQHNEQLRVTKQLPPKASAHQEPQNTGAPSGEASTPTEPLFKLSHL